MYCKLTTQEKLQDLRKARKLTLTELAEKTGISSSTLSEYENNEDKDITSHSLEVLSDFYGVSIDYLMSKTENHAERFTPVEELHLTDDAIEILKSGKINTRLLSEIITHENFSQMMIDSEIYVDRIAEDNFRNMNTYLEIVRQQIIDKADPDSNDLYTRTLKASQISEESFFGKTIHEDLMAILADIRKAHTTDSTTSDKSGADYFFSAMQDTIDTYKAISEEPDPDEKEKLAAYNYLRKLSINPSKLNKHEFTTLIGILRKSNLMKVPRQGSHKKKR